MATPTSDPDTPTPYLARPTLAGLDELREGFDQRLAQLIARGEDPGPLGRERAAWPFLCHLADERGLLLHGSGDPGISRFEPRQAHDRLLFGNRRAVYAASDGIWALFYAILDRSRSPLSMVTCCFRTGAVTAERSWRYFFSVTRSALAQAPWHRGTVYILPRDGFEQEGSTTASESSSMQWSCSQPVRPLARISVGPDDFPFLAQVRGHDDQELAARMAADPKGFPWAGS